MRRVAIIDAHSRAVRIDVQFIGGCPNHRPMVELVAQLAAARGIRVDIREREIRTEAEAHQAQFRGSPTLLIDGRDIESDTAFRGPYALSCRLYDGKGLPDRRLVETTIENSARLKTLPNRPPRRIRDVT